MKMQVKRRLSYWYYRIVRGQGTPEYIARGWGIGMFIGCVIPMSFQLMISIPLSFLLKGSKIGATLGTLITNPITVIFIYPTQCWVGDKLIGGHLSLAAVNQALRELLRNQDWATLLSLSGELIAAFFIGGLLLGAVMTPITYFGVLRLVIRYRAFREKRLAARRAQEL